MTEIKVDLEAWCQRCGAGLCSNITARKQAGRISIEPCEKCLENARDEGFDAGKSERDSLG